MTAKHTRNSCSNGQHENFIAFLIFLMIKMINKLKAKPKEEAAPAKPSEEVVLLSEIRDELKKMGPSSL